MGEWTQKSGPLFFFFYLNFSVITIPGSRVCYRFNNSQNIWRHHSYYQTKKRHVNALKWRVMLMTVIRVEGMEVQGNVRLILILIFLLSIEHVLFGLSLLLLWLCVCENQYVTWESKQLERKRKTWNNWRRAKRWR